MSKTAPERAAARSPGAPAPSEKSKGGGGGAANKAPSPDASAAESESRPDGAAATHTAAPVRQQRMVHYNGALKLRAPDPAATLARASKLGEQAGGYIETLTETSIVLRVPVARFREVFAAVAALGAVLARSMSAEDVTDAFVAADLRVKILRASRNRLVGLLARSRDAAAKLELLREIQRLTEQIDQLEATLTELRSLAAYSRLTMEVVVPRPELEATAGEPIAAFRWIEQLSPFHRQVAEEGRRLVLTVPKGMVELEHRDCWIAESADGALLWASRRDNVPEGTTDFWLAALRSRLEREYAQTEVLTMGAYKVLRLIDAKENNAYRYLVGVRVDGSKLEVIEAYFGSAAQESRYADAVQAAIAGGAT